MSSVYFISDLHLGAPNAEASLVREKKFVSWLEQIRPQLKTLYVVGDLFDFWFEYKRAVPRGFTRAIGKLAELSDQGVEIHLFTGNHDLWIFDYLPGEIGAKLHREPIHIEHQGLHLMVGHGDGLGPGDHGYKFLKKIFTNPFLQWMFARLHPNFGVWLASQSSQLSRKHTGGEDAKFLGPEEEWLYQYCKEQEALRHHDLYIFGHRHLPIDLNIGDSSRYVNLGDWVQYFTYGCIENGKWMLKEHLGNVNTDPEAFAHGR